LQFGVDNASALVSAAMAACPQTYANMRLLSGSNGLCSEVKLVESVVSDGNKK